MKLSHNRGVRRGNQDGQALILFTLFSIVLILFVGLGIDMGFAYVTKAQLAKAVDAATLAAVSNYSGADKGAAANALAINTFYANYATNGVSGRSTGGKKVTPTGTFGTDATGNLTYTMNVADTVNTYFIGLLPQWKTLTIGDLAEATRAPVVMTLVLDRTGSMTPGIQTGPCVPGTGGGAYLPGAVTQFINIFDETLDRAALVTFSVSAVNNVPMTAKGTPFKTTIISEVNAMPWAGTTCSVAGLTNALIIQNNAGAPANAIKVVVFFTDGRANMTTYRFPTTPKGGIVLNFGGGDPSQIGCPGVADPGANFWLPTTPENSQATVCPAGVGCGNIFTCTQSFGGTNITATQVWTNALGIPELFCGSDITEDATNRCVLIANQMRASSNYVYAVGLTADLNTFAAPSLEQLQQVANDPASSTFNPTQPVGAAFISDGNDLSEVFQQVAADIILRLVQ
jgi:Flp pilus assembly protein TadG